MPRSFLRQLTLVVTPLLSSALQAEVNLPFEVPFSGGGFNIIEANNVRGMFPDGDIFITSFSFLGVTVNEKDIFSHMTLHDELGQHRPTDDWFHHKPWPVAMKDLPGTFSDDFVYHHTILHQGTTDDYFDHSQPALVYGTTTKNISFSPFGHRLRPDTPISACMHGRNVAAEHATFVAKWVIDYEIVQSFEKNSLSLLGGWFHCCDQRDLVGEKDSIPLQVTFAKNVTLVGFVVHNHRWLQGLSVEYEKLQLLALDAAEAERSDDAQVKWLPGGPIRILQGTSLDISISTFVLSEPGMFKSQPMGVTFFMVPDDGTVTLATVDDLYEIQDPTGAVLSQNDRDHIRVKARESMKAARRVAANGRLRGPAPS
jgi:hypothetical protein